MKIYLSLFLIVFIFILLIIFNIENNDNEILLNIGLSLFLSISITYLIYLIMFFKNAIKLNAKIIYVNKGFTEFKSGNSNRYYFEYIYKNKKYKHRLSYSTSTDLSTKESIILLKDPYTKTIILKKHLLYFFIINVFFNILLLILIIK